MLASSISGVSMKFSGVFCLALLMLGAGTVGFLIGNNYFGQPKTSIFLGEAVSMPDSVLVGTNPFGLIDSLSESRAATLPSGAKSRNHEILEAKILASPAEAILRIPPLLKDGDILSKIEVNRNGKVVQIDF
jgi:hypothetical protein